jgi:hypothetical protein
MLPNAFNNTVPAVRPLTLMVLPVLLPDEPKLITPAGEDTEMAPPLAAFAVDVARREAPLGRLTPAKPAMSSWPPDCPETSTVLKVTESEFDVALTIGPGAVVDTAVMALVMFTDPGATRANPDAAPPMTEEVTPDNFKFPLKAITGTISLW